MTCGHGHSGQSLSRSKSERIFCDKYYGDNEDFDMLWEKNLEFDIAIRGIVENAHHHHIHMHVFNQMQLSFSWALFEL